MNITSSGMISSYRSSDAITNTLKSTWLTSKAKQSLHEMDKQAEENATFLFEYKALLNSKLTTLTTALTSAYTTDLDASLGSMQGATGSTNTDGEVIIDPGAARVTRDYFTTWSRTTSLSLTVGTIDTAYGNLTAANPADTGQAVTISWNPPGRTGAAEPDFLLNTVGTDGLIAGTTTMMSAKTVNPSNLELDALEIDFLIQNGINKTTFINPKGGTSPQIGNNFEQTLYNFFSKKENHDVIKFGMFDNITVVGTSSLPTGSQVQGSLLISWVNNDARAGIVINQQAFNAFYHS